MDPDQLRGSTRHVYHELLDWKAEHNGNSPFLTELAAACFLSPSTIKYHLFKLERYHLIEVNHRVKAANAINIPGSIWLPPAQAKEFVPWMKE